MSDTPRRYEWEDYLYPPGADGEQVLRNHLGLTDRAAWHVAERILTLGRYDELQANPRLVPRTFDAAHWKAIHRHLFQDMYAWAGEFRTVDMVNPANGDRAFVHEEVLEDAAENFLANVREAGLFADRDRAGVVLGLAATLQGVNFIHPFREGNGRTQRVLADHIAFEAGYLLDWQRMAAETQNEVMARSFAGDLAPLREALEHIAVPRVRGGSVDSAPAANAPAPERAPDFWRFTKTPQQVLEQHRSSAPAMDAARPATRGRSAEPGLEP